MTNTTNSQTETREIHPFERTGCGVAPFRFVGMEQQDMAYGQVCLNRAEFDRSGILLTTKPGGTCRHCGEYIVNMYRVRDALGREFHVGCECIKKVARECADTAMLRAIAKAEAPARAAKAAKARASREARKAAAAKRNAETVDARHGDLLARLDRLVEYGSRYAAAVAADMAKTLRTGKCADLSDRQLAFVAKLEGETD